jgi:hypothetical protein
MLTKFDSRVKFPTYNRSGGTVPGPLGAYNSGVSDLPRCGLNKESPVRRNSANDQRLTVYLPEGAVAGRVMQFLDTGLTAWVEGVVPRYERYRFTLHLQGAVIAGEVTSLGQEDSVCRLQFAALTPEDRARLEPWIEAES